MWLLSAAQQITTIKPTSSTDYFLNIYIDGLLPIFRESLGNFDICGPV